MLHVHKGNLRGQWCEMMATYYLAVLNCARDRRILVFEKWVNATEAAPPATFLAANKAFWFHTVCTTYFASNFEAICTLVRHYSPDFPVPAPPCNSIGITLRSTLVGALAAWFTGWFVTLNTLVYAESSDMHLVRVCNRYHYFHFHFVCVLCVRPQTTSFKMSKKRKLDTVTTES